MGTPARLVILYGTGGLSDVGRHAVQAALERKAEVDSIKVLTKHPDLLEEANWKCGCEKPHSFTEEERKRFQVVTVKTWKEDLSPHFQDATAVVSCLGNRQPFIGGWDSAPGNEAVIRAMKEKDVSRVVVLTSVGIEEDWPPVEMFTPGKIILSALFFSFAWWAFRDLTKMERAYRGSDLDFLLVRPVGIGEDVKPDGKWFIQKEKYVDEVGFNMAKLDVARYLVEEALNPTRHKSALVLGAAPGRGFESS